MWTSRPGGWRRRDHSDQTAAASLQPACHLPLRSTAGLCGLVRDPDPQLDIGPGRRMEVEKRTSGLGCGGSVHGESSAGPTRCRVARDAHPGPAAQTPTQVCKLRPGGRVRGLVGVRMRGACWWLKLELGRVVERLNRPTLGTGATPASFLRPHF